MYSKLFHGSTTRQQKESLIGKVAERRGRMAGALATMMLAMSVVMGQGNQGAAADFVHETTPLPVARHFHGAAVMADKLYVFGGADAAQKPILGTVFAPINNDGSLGAWQATTPLPSPRMYVANSTLVLNDTVYVLGGAAEPLADKYFNTALVSRPDSSGQLGPWTESPPFGRGAGTIAAVSTPGHIHAIGGLGANSKQESVVLGDVWTSAVLPDGTLGPWTEGPRLPTPLWYHNAAAAGGRVWVWGGLRLRRVSVEGSLSPLVFSAPILGDGRLGEWHGEEQKLARPFYSSTSGVVGPYLLAIGARYSAQEISSDVWWSTVSGTGLTPWRMRPAPTLPHKIYHATAYDYRRGVIYVPGGRASMDNKQPSAKTFALVLSPEARRAGEQTWEQAELRHSISVSEAFGDSMVGAAGTTGVASLAYLAESTLPDDAPKGFVTQRAAQQRPPGATIKPMVLYFRSGAAKPSLDQEAALRSLDFEKLAESTTFVWIDVREMPQIAQQHGVFRVPTWLFFDTIKGLPVARHTGVLAMPELVDKTLETKRSQGVGAAY